MRCVSQADVLSILFMVSVLNHMLFPLIWCRSSLFLLCFCHLTRTVCECVVTFSSISSTFLEIYEKICQKILVRSGTSTHSSSYGCNVSVEMRRTVLNHSNVGTILTSFIVELRHFNMVDMCYTAICWPAHRLLRWNNVERVQWINDSRSASIQTTVGMETLIGTEVDKN